MDLQILHTTEGDKKKKMDTKTEAGRKDAQKLIDGLLRKGTAIFLETARDTYRVIGYDPKRDTVKVRIDDIEGSDKRKTKQVGRSAGKARMTAVAPRAGG